MIVIPHYHEFAEVIKITNGSAELIINAEKFICNKGDIIYVPPFCMHSLYSVDSNTEITGLVFDFSLISIDVCGYSVKEILRKEAVNWYVICESNGVYDLLNSSFLNAIRLYNSNNNTYKIQMLAFILNICTALVNNYFSKKDFAKLFISGN